MHGNAYVFLYLAVYVDWLRTMSFEENSFLNLATMWLSNSEQLVTFFSCVVTTVEQILLNTNNLIFHKFQCPCLNRVCARDCFKHCC